MEDIDKLFESIYYNLHNDIDANFGNPDTLSDELYRIIESVAQYVTATDRDKFLNSIQKRTEELRKIHYISTHTN